MSNGLMKCLMAVCLIACSLSPVKAADGAKEYSNPVIKWSLPDPTVIQASDGYFYLYATEDTHNVPIYRSKDLVTWRYAGTAFTDATRPMDFVPRGGIWAPDINYIDGKYVLYYSKSEWGKTWECGIGVAWSDKPNGGFHDAHKLFISSEVGIENCIDPFFIRVDSCNYLFWGSFHDIYGVQLTDDGLAIKEGAVPQKIAGGFIEATMIVKHDTFFYLIGSTGTCCEGAKSTYRLVMARSRNLFGPYVDRNGGSAVGDHFSPLLNSSPEVYGPGHCSEFVTDHAGQTWMLYHGYQSSDVEAGRVVYLDKITWGNDGWPQVQGMRPSTTSEAPVFDNAVGISEKKTEDAAYLIHPVDEGGYYRIDGPDGETFSWQLYNVSGHLVLNGKSKGMDIVDTSSMLKGMYVIKVNGKAGASSGKILRL